MRVPNLQSVLMANAVFSGLSALLILSFQAELAEYVINIPSLAFIIVGVGLALFALDLFLTARNASVSRGKAIMVIAADVAWVLLTPVVLFFLSEEITGPGIFLLIDIALIVAVFAVLQWAGISSLSVSVD